MIVSQAVISLSPYDGLHINLIILVMNILIMTLKYHFLSHHLMRDGRIQQERNFHRILGFCTFFSSRYEAIHCLI